MSQKLPVVAIPLQVLRARSIDDDVEHKRSVSRELQIVTSSSSSPFRLPDGWVVEERPRVSNPSHVDRYYYEPHTRRQFRSLLAVKRHLTGETRDYAVSKRMVSESENANYIESGSGQRFGSLRAVEKFLSGENACPGSTAATATPESVVKSGIGEQRARGVRSSRKPAHKRSSVVEEDKCIPESLKHAIQSPDSKKLDSRKKTKSEKDNRASVHNLTEPPPEKVSWVLSGTGGFWSPFLDGTVVTDSEKLKWSEAFVLSIHDDGVINS